MSKEVPYLLKGPNDGVSDGVSFIDSNLIVDQNYLKTLLADC